MKQHQPLARMTISLPPELRRRVQRAAHEDELSVSRYVAHLLRQHFAEVDRREAEELRNPHRPHQISMFSSSRG